MEPGTLIAVALAAAVVLALLWTLSRRKKPKSWVQETVCPKCGWRGRVSSYAGRCPRCNTPIGNQRARPTS